MNERILRFKTALRLGGCISCTALKTELVAGDVWYMNSLSFDIWPHTGVELSYGTDEHTTD